MGSLSTHLLNSYNMANQHIRTPFSHSPTQPHIVSSGPMSYSPAMHGSNFGLPPPTPFPALTDPSSIPQDPTYYDISVATHKQIASLQAKLDQKLGPEYISQRPGPGGGPKLTYAEGWKIINLANEVFGFNGWSSSICGLTIDYLDDHDEGRRWNCGVSAVVRVTLRDGVYHEDVGYGTAENVKGKAIALEKCKKEAVTDAIKRTLRNFGNLLGNCLYDKQYTKEIVKIKVQQPKFDSSSLHRRPEFEEKARGGGPGSKVGTVVDATLNVKRSIMPPPHPMHQAVNMNSPAHVKRELGPSSIRVPAQQSNPQPALYAQPPARSAALAPSSNSAECSTSTLTSHQTHLVPSPPEQPCIDPEEASYFNSDDDALFMQVDMEDLGSMMPEEDRPIEYDNEANEGNSTMSINQEEFAQHPKSGPSPPNRSSPATNPTNNIRGQGQTSHPNPHQQPQPPPVQPQVGKQKPQQRPAPPLPQAAPQQALQQRRQPQNEPGRNHQQQPLHRPPKYVPVPTTAASCPATPSIGGFHFPPGSDSTRHVNRLSGPSTSAGPRPAQVVGMKRSADAMNGSVMYGNHVNTPNCVNGNEKPRAPLAPLEVGEGGDVKRVKQ